VGMKLRGTWQQVLAEEEVPGWRSTAVGGRY